MNNFTRGEDPMKSMGLGDFSFNTLKNGAIIRSTKWFGISESSGKFGGYHSSKISVNANSYFLIYDIIRIADKMKFKFLKTSERDVRIAREEMKEGKRPWALWATKGFINLLTKRRFDYRFEIIEPGIRES